MCQGGRGVSGGSGSLAFLSSRALASLPSSDMQDTSVLYLRQFWHQKSSGLLLSGHEVPTEISLAGVNFLIAEFPQLLLYAFVCAHTHTRIFA